MKISKHIYTFNEYEQDIKTITEMIQKYNKETHIIAPYRGGLPLGVALSNRTESPLSILDYQRYDGDSDKVSLIKNANIASNQTLVLVDDLVDEGITIKKCIEFLHENFPNNPIQIITIFGRKDIDFAAPNLYVREKTDGWIQFEPWE